MKRALLFLFFACWAFAAEDPAELMQARNEYDARLAPLRAKLEEAVKIRTSKYAVELKGLEDRSAAAGQLDAVMAIQKEREVYEKGSATPGFDAKNHAAPPGAKQLRATFDADVQRIRSNYLPQGRRMAADYLEHLAALERKLTTQKDITGALAIRKEKETVQQNEMDPLNPASTITGQWSYSHQGKKIDRTYTFYRDGTWENTIQDRGLWKWSDRNKRKLSWDYKIGGGTRVDDCVLSADGRQLVGHDDSNSPIILERLP